MQIWVADGERGLMRGQHGIYRRVGAPGRALCAAAGKIFCAGEKRCVCYDRETAEPLFDFAVPPEVCALAAMGDSVYALSADADSVTAFSADTGEARFCAPAGNYPRALRASPGATAWRWPAGRREKSCSWTDACARWGGIACRARRWMCVSYPGAWRRCARWGTGNCPPG